MRTFTVAFITAFLILTATCSAHEYYADVIIDVADTGTVTVSGISNHESLEEGSYESYTTKNGAHWLLNITTDDIFSDYVYTVRMPSGSAINYLKSSGKILIKHDSDRIILEGVGSDDAFMLVVQYTINLPDYSGYYWLLLIPVIVVFAFIFYKKRPGEKKHKYNPDMLSERQLSIAEALEKNGRPMTQRQLEEALGLPKSSVSRNISSLVKAGILVKHSRGMSNAVWFAENGEE